MDETGVPGIAVGVVFDDEVLFTEGYGVREAGRAATVGPETVFQIASLSKPISSTIMAGLVGRGAFGWDDPVVAYNPDFALSDPASTEALTFADLFSHRSGIPGAGGDVLEAVGYERDEILRRLRFLPVEPIGDHLRLLELRHDGGRRVRRGRGRHAMGGARNGGPVRARGHGLDEHAPRGLPGRRGPGRTPRAGRLRRVGGRLRAPARPPGPRRAASART